MNSFPPLSTGNPTGHEEDDKDAVGHYPQRNGESQRSRRPACRSSRVRLDPVKPPVHHLLAKTITDFRGDGIMYKFLFQGCLDEKAAFIPQPDGEMQDIPR